MTTEVEALYGRLIYGWLGMVECRHTLQSQVLMAGWVWSLHRKQIWIGNCK